MRNETPPRLAAARRAAAVLALVLAAGACGTDADFDSAARTNTAAAWDDYLRAHPDGAHAREARERLTALLEDGEWQRARATDTADAYQRYLRGYPQGQHAHDALVAIANLNLAATPSAEPPAEPAPAPAPAPAGATPPAAKPAAAASVPPAGQRAPAGAAAVPAAPQAAQRAAQRAAPPAAPATAAAPPAGGYRVQLGAFADGTAAAERAWRRLAARHPQLAAHAPAISSSRAADGRTLTRLQVAGLDRSGAEALCAALAARQDPCLLVPPPGAAARPPR